MSGSSVSGAISRLREMLGFYAQEDISKLGDADLIDYANERIGDLEFSNSLYHLALANNVSAPEFERWFSLAVEKFAELQEGEEISEEDLLDLLKEIRS